MLEIRLCRTAREIRGFFRAETDFHTGAGMTRAEKRAIVGAWRPARGCRSAAFLLALREGKPVARMMTFVRDGHGWFSLTDGQNDAQAVQALVAWAAAQARRQGAADLIGPVSPDESGYREGVRAAGFETAAAALTNDNGPWMDSLLRAAGLAVWRETYAYRVPVPAENPYARVAEWAQARFSLETRPLRARTRADYEAVYALSRETGADFNAFCRVLERLRRGLDPGGSWLVFCAGRPVGMILSLKGHRGAPMRVATLRTADDMQRRGVTAVLLAQVANAAARRGDKWVEASLIDATNVASNACVKTLQGEISGIYRVYWMEFRKN